MQSIYDIFRTDTVAEVDGRWVRIGDSEFLLARAGGGNTKFSSALAAAMKPYQRLQALGQFPEVQAREVMAGPFVKYVLLDWRTRTKEFDENDQPKYVPHQILGKDGKTMMTYSADTAKRVMIDIPDLFLELMETAGKFTTFAPEDIEAAAKN